MSDLNKTVAEFCIYSHKYEIDLLLDKLMDDYAVYDIFDVTYHVVGEVIGNFTLEQQTENDYMTSELIEEAKKVIDKEAV